MLLALGLRGEEITLEARGESFKRVAQGLRRKPRCRRGGQGKRPARECATVANENRPVKLTGRFTTPLSRIMP
ncbi:hypothetical protein GCM10022626_19410 [[Pseudomonas] carboxydohydrogena]